MHYTLAIVLCALLASHGIRRKSLSPSGAAAAVLVGLGTFTNGNAGVTAALLVFYLSSSRITKIGHDTKAKLEDGHVEGGQRTAIQVFSNGFTGTALSVLYQVTCAASVRSFFEDVLHGKRVLADCDGQWRLMMLVAYVSHYACCNGDTWSSEIGILAKQPPRLITAPWRTVPPGTNGGVTPLGLAASFAGGLTIGLTMAVSSLAQSYTTQSFISSSSFPHSWTFTVIFWLCVGGAAGLLGSILDSLLGATLQQSLYDPDHKKCVDARRVRSMGKKRSDFQHVCGSDFLDNNQVNFVSSLVTAISGGLLVQVWGLAVGAEEDAVLDSRGWRTNIGRTEDYQDTSDIAETVYSPTISAGAQNNLIFGVLPVWAVATIGGGVGGIALIVLCVLCTRKGGKKTRPKPMDYQQWEEGKRSRESTRMSPSRMSPSYAQSYESYEAYDMPQPTHNLGRQHTSRPDAVSRGYSVSPSNDTRRRQQNLQHPQGAYGGAPKSMAPYAFTQPQTVAMPRYEDSMQYQDDPSLPLPPPSQAPQTTMVNVKGPPPSIAPGALANGQPPPHWLFEKLAVQQGKLGEQSVPYTGPPLEVHTAYEAGASDEMSLFPGQTVELRDVFRDGWAVGWNRDTEGFGALPLDALYLNIAAASLGVPQASARSSVRMDRFVSQTLATQSSVLTERQRLRTGQSKFLRKGNSSGSTLMPTSNSQEMSSPDRYAYSTTAPLPGGTQVLRPAQSRRM
ncbi:Transmembrane protein 19 [Gonapodya sp. JEL0774]|nr:Transmembrane protein 19 [Gonapodya sp. JEL0774]